MLIIANPRAGHGRGRRYIERLPVWLRRVGLEGRVTATRGPGDATRLAREAAESGHGRLTVMGGDGTIREVAEGLLGSEVVLGLIPVGTGNDLARSLGLPINRPEQALEVLRDGRVCEMDAGWDDGHCFLSVLGVGYPAMVAEEANRLQWVQGAPSYFISICKALLRLRKERLRLVLDEQELDVGCTSILIHNTPYTGGGLHMAPMASLNDGYLDVVVIASDRRFDLIWSLPKVYRGTHLGHPHFHHFRSRTVRVTSDRPVSKMRDGDAGETLPVDARVLPSALRVICAANAGLGGEVDGAGR